MVSESAEASGAPQAIEGSATIVTGAARGIGRDIARRLAQLGAKLILADIDASGLEDSLRDARQAGAAAIAVPTDISEPADCHRLARVALAEYGRIDSLVNNAAIDCPQQFAWDIDDGDWRRLLRVDLDGPWWCTKAVLPAMMRQRHGKVVFISSIAARVGSDRGSPAYAAAKGGLIGLAAGLAAQLESYGVLVNAITPGATGNTGTPMPDEVRAQMTAAYPLGLRGPRPVTDAVCYLLGPSGDWVSGSVLNVSGGQLRGI